MRETAKNIILSFSHFFLLTFTFSTVAFCWRVEWTREREKSEANNRATMKNKISPLCRMRLSIYAL